MNLQTFLKLSSSVVLCCVGCVCHSLSFHMCHENERGVGDDLALSLKLCLCILETGPNFRGNVLQCGYVDVGVNLLCFCVFPRSGCRGRSIRGW